MIYLVEAVDTENVQEFLNLAFDCIKRGNIELIPRRKNLMFQKRSGLTDTDIANMILQLEPKECIAVDKNKNTDHNPDSILYTFIHKYKMYNDKNKVIPQKVFIKMYVDKKNGKYVDVIVSFHKEHDYSKESVNHEKERMLLSCMLRLQIV